jgi:hypothetical protein
MLLVLQKPFNMLGHNLDAGESVLTGVGTEHRSEVRG